jgi:hypothetical protein
MTPQIPDFRMIIFETYASVFELMWDIALAYFITQIALVYWTVTFLSSCLLAFVYDSSCSTLPLHHYLFLPVNILVAAIISRLLIYYYDIPRVVGFRLAIGLLASIFMIITDALAGRVHYSEGLGHWAWPTMTVDIVKRVVGILLFSLMPALWMLAEEAMDDIREQHIRHRHGKKNVLDAL